MNCRRCLLLSQKMTEINLIRSTHVPSFREKQVRSGWQLLLCLLLLAPFQSILAATEVTVLQPTTYTRTAGPPDKFVTGFLATPDTGKLTVMNGDSSGRNRVSNAVIRLNGEVLLGPASLIQNQPKITREVKLLDSNSLSVELASRPGSFLTITFTQETKAGPPLITGVIRDRSTNSPVPNARVFFYGSATGTVFTDSNGTYVFSASDLVSFGGGISGYLRAGATGYFEAPAVWVADLSTQQLPVVEDISLLPGGTVIEGTVRDASNGSGIAAAIVSFNGSPLSMGGGTVQTDSSGVYHIDSSYFSECGVSGGTLCPPPNPGFNVTLTVNANGYLGATQFLNFLAYPVIQDFSLVSSPGMP